MLRLSPPLPDLSLEYIRKVLKIEGHVYENLRETLVRHRAWVEDAASPTLWFALASREELSASGGGGTKNKEETATDNRDDQVVIGVFTFGEKGTALMGRMPETEAILFDQVLNVYVHHAVREIPRHVSGHLACEVSTIQDFSATAAGVEKMRHVLSRLQTSSVRMNESGFLLPVKSLVFYMETGEKSAKNACQDCRLPGCLHRDDDTVVLSVAHQRGDDIHVVERGKNLLHLLKETGYHVPSPCGGEGTCGKCLVTTRTLDGTEELLACRHRVDSDMHVEGVYHPATQSVSLPFRRRPFSALTIESRSGEDVYRFYDEIVAAKESVKERGPLVLGIDLGTTTVRIAAWGMDGTIQGGRGFLNPQSAMGADVISRIAAGAKEDALAEMRRLVMDALNEHIAFLLGEIGSREEDVLLTLLCGNTVMQHIIQGYPIAQMGHAPYLPHTRKESLRPSRDFGLRLAGSLFVFPVFSAFVGGDIVSGIIALDEPQKTTLLIDLGTNGEIALIHDNHHHVASTAAGPAFEGGKISCGTGAITGAVYAVERRDGEYVPLYEGNGHAGFSGSGLVSFLARLLEDGVIDELGRMIHPNTADGTRRFHLDAGLFLDQQDIRELQLAKAAIRGGIHALLDFAGVKMEDIEDVVLTGAFGMGLSADDLVKTGILDKVLARRIRIHPQAPLDGIAQLMKSKNPKNLVQKLVEGTETIPLTKDRTFYEVYVESMHFREFGGKTDDDELG